MPSTNPTATASAISRPRSVKKMHRPFGPFGMLDRTHAEPALTRLAQGPVAGSQFTVKSGVVSARKGPYPTYFGMFAGMHG